MALDAPSAAFVSQTRLRGFLPVQELGAVAARKARLGVAALYGVAPAMWRVHDAAVPRDDGSSLTIRVFTPRASPRGLLVYLHGGGWVIGTLDEFDHLARHLAHETGCAVLLVDYRLAPEHPHPAALDDAWAALCWADANRAAIAGPPVPLIVAGDSAGGNLAAVVVQRAVRRARPTVALQVLVYPITNYAVDTPSYVDPANQLLLTRESMLWFWDQYLPDAADRGRVDASPLRAEDLGPQPSAVVLTAEHDVLRDEGEAYAQLLRDTGTTVEHRRFAGQMHGFFTMVNLLPGHREGLDYVVQAISERLAAIAEPSDDGTPS